MAIGIRAVPLHLWCVHLALTRRTGHETDAPLLRRLYPSIIHILTVLHAFIPRAPLLPISDSIIFEDVLGRSYKLQYEHFRHWNVSRACVFNLHGS